MPIRAPFKVFAAFVALALLGPRPATAQSDYPSRAITVVVAFAAGGTSDIIARLLAQKLSEYTGVSVIVENVPGAATILGTEKVARSQPDGYMLYLASSTPFATNPNFYKNLKYSIDDFEPITLVARVPLILDVNPKFPGSTVKEFVAYAQSKPNGVTIATPGKGSVGEIVNGMTRGLLEIPVTNVPYRGGAPAVTDVMKGVVDAYYDAISSSLPLVQGGTIKALAITGSKRSPGAPDVPTLVELGYKDFVLENLYTVVARKGTPRPIVEKLNGLLRRAMDDPEFKSILLKQGVVPEPATPEDTRVAIQHDYEWNASMVKRFNIQPVD
jgi:tripartite-type tricarboxylate transporter receptor subunit TctC